jgi:DNA-binding transcriptional LysR family regulator
MDRVELMSLAVSIAEAGSLSAASRKLGMPVPTVSRKLSELEARLDAALPPIVPAPVAHRRRALLRRGVPAYSR